MNRRNRNAPRPAIAPIPRAVRKALAASAALVALSLPAAALIAGDCHGLAAASRCEAPLASLAQDASLWPPVDDPSHVVDGGIPAAVQPMALPPGAVGGIVVSDAEAADLYNVDGIAVHAEADGDAQAYAGVAGSAQFAYLTNAYAGSLSADAISQDGTALAVGAYAYAGDAASLWNYGAVSADAYSAHGDAQAYAAVVAGVPAGIGLLINGGDMDAHAEAGEGGEAHATGAYVVADVATVFNDAGIDASAATGADGIAVARGAATYGRYAAAYSYGDVAVQAAGGLSAAAAGIDVQGYYGASAYNAGAIAVAATADGDAIAAGSNVIATVFGAYSTNAGTIEVAADGASASATGMLNASLNIGDAIAVNDGDIATTANGGIAAYGEVEASAVGIYSLATVYAAAVYNNGTVAATASATADIGGTYGFLQAKAVGAQATSVYGYGDTVMANAGDIDAAAMASQGYASAWGAVAMTSGRYGGTAVFANEGAVSAQAHIDIGVANAIGAYALDQFADVEATNQGDIDASAHAGRGIGYVVDYAYAIGMKAASYYGTVGIDNHGDITALASGDGAITGARGIQASGAAIAISNAEGAVIGATGEVDTFGGGFATGIEANGIYYIGVVNDGDIDVYGHAHAYGTHYGASRALGIYAAAGFQGDVAVANNGSITATALSEDSISFFQGGAGAAGINAYAKYDATIVNNGDIVASAQSELGITSAYGVIGHGKYTTSVVNEAGANIVAEATAGSLDSDNYGGRAFTAGVHVFGNGMEHGEIYNAGSIVAHAISTAESASLSPGMANARGASIGAYSNVLTGTVVNMGDIEAAAGADFGYATAYGNYVVTGYASDIGNAGSVRASATAEAGNAFAVGVHAFSRHDTRSYNCYYKDGPYGQYYFCDWANPVVTLDGGESQIDNSGGILAMASAEGGLGYSYGAAAFGALSASITNSGSISAITEADAAKATGALVNGMYGDASLVNSGDILAAATGTSSTSAIGAWVRAANGAQVDNDGRILAGAYGAGASAIGVKMGDAGSNLLANSGTIGAYGDGERIAVWSGVDATAVITNGGTLVGAVVTGDLDDSLDNAAGGSWLALGESDFGAGDDAVANAGTLRMRDATIDLGDAATANAFANTGTIAVAGAGNAIDMGGAFAFRNDGAIDFGDGMADDLLAIDGDFAGTGSLRFDADLGAQTGDLLQVGGEVSATQAIRVDAVGVPATGSTRIALVRAGGTLDGTFTLAGVQQAPVDFLAMDFGLAQSADTLWLETSVTGLNDTGSLAASLSAGAANFLGSQVGTFRQRLGANPYGDPGKVMSAFLRFHGDEGDVAPRHAAAGFGQGGHFDFNQSSQGREVGVNANLSGNFHAGVVLGSADSRQRLIHGGAGENRLDGMTWGAYATWYVPQGVYVDLSGRWMAADVKSTSAAGVMATRAHVSATSLEAGYEWSVGGFGLVPQLQYTRIAVEDVRPLSGNGADFTSQGGTYKRGRLGVELNRSFTVGAVRVTPYASVNAVREFDGESGYAVAGVFAGSTSVAGTSTMAELGLGVQKGGFGFNLGAHWTDGGAYDGFVGGQASIRYSW